MDVAQPIKLFEYAAMGVPVVAPPAVEVKRLIVEHELGVLSADYSAQAYATALVGLLREPARAKKLGENGRKAVEEKYNWAAQARELEKILLNAIGT